MRRVGLCPRPARYCRNRGSARGQVQKLTAGKVHEILLAVAMHSAKRYFVGKSWSQESEQGDKWCFCLTAGKIDPRIRRDDEQTSTPEPHTGFQGEGGTCGDQGRDDAVRTGTAV